MASVPTLVAEPAPPAREFETRVLHDHDDDHYLDVVQDGHDLIALDLREMWDPTAKEAAVVFRLTMAGGYAAVESEEPTLTETVSFLANGTEHSYTFETVDNANYTGTFDQVVGPYPADDGDSERFYVEGLLYHSTLGAPIGANLTGFQVEGDSDEMPGSPLAPVGEEAAVEASYILAGPVRYVAASVSEETVALTARTPVTLDLAIRNLLGAHNQTVQVRAEAPFGITAVPAGGDRFASPLLLEPDEEAVVPVVIEADRALEGTLLFEVVSSLGGRVVVPVELTATEPPRPDPEPDPPATPTPVPMPATTQVPLNDTAEHHSANATHVTEESPVWPFAGIVTVALFAVMASRRR